MQKCRDASYDRYVRITGEAINSSSYIYLSPSPTLPPNEVLVGILFSACP